MQVLLNYDLTITDSVAWLIIFRGYALVGLWHNTCRRRLRSEFCYQPSIFSCSAKKRKKKNREQISNKRRGFAHKRNQSKTKRRDWQHLTERTHPSAPPTLPSRTLEACRAWSGQNFGWKHFMLLTINFTADNHRYPALRAKEWRGF